MCTYILYSCIKKHIYIYILALAPPLYIDFVLWTSCSCGTHREDKSVQHVGSRIRSPFGQKLGRKVEYQFFLNCLHSWRTPTSLTGFSNRSLDSQITPQAHKSLPGLPNQSPDSQITPRALSKQTQALNSFPRLSNHYTVSRIIPQTLKSFSGLSNDSLGSKITRGLSNHCKGSQMIPQALKSLPGLPNQCKSLKVNEKH